MAPKNPHRWISLFPAFAVLVSQSSWGAENGPLCSLFPSSGSIGVPARHDGSRPRKLLELGWDEPDLRFLVHNRAVMERSPFDGCVFHVNTSVPGKKPESL
jgi:hypothetical protein